MALSKAELELIKDISSFSKDPYKFVLYSFPWGEKGTTLEKYTKPEQWQIDILKDISKGIITAQEAIKIAVASGHGVGKSCLVAWIILWALSTFEDTRVVVTANTDRQLMTKTWPELSKWYRLFVAKHWFKYTATSLYSVETEHEKTWRADAIPWSVNNTEAFAGLHNKGKRIVLIFDEACHDDKTEVLTQKGWKYFKDLDGSESLLTMNVDTRIAEYLKPVSLHATHRKGEMIRYRIRGSSFLVTPNHRMLIESQNKVKCFRTAGELASKKNLEVKIPRQFLWTAPDKEHIVIPSLVTDRRAYKETVFDADGFIELLGWYGSEGHLSFSCGRYRSVGFTQKNTNHIEELCKRLGLNPKVYKDCSTPQVRVHNTQLAEWLSQFGVGCKVKRVPEIIRTLSSRQIDIYLNAYREGDGYKKGNRDILYTSSKLMADDLQELCFLAGQQSSITKRSLEGKISHFKTHDATSSCDGYIVSRTWSNTETHLKTRKLEKVEYDGMVYCATLPKHGVLFTRRDGVCMWSGNSAIDNAVWEVAEGALTDEDTEIIWLGFGNPTRNTGRFRECFGKYSHRWITKQVDSRSVEITNKKEIAKWEQDYGTDSDFFKVRVKGEFPNTSAAQFIPTEYASNARGKKLDPASYAFAPSIIGVDPAWSGEDEIAIFWRKGYASKLLASYKKIENDLVVAGYVAQFEDEYKADAVFVDMGYGTGIVSAGKAMKRSWTLVSFASESNDPGFLNKRGQMWNDMKKWLHDGGSTPDDPVLEEELISPEYYVKLNGKIVLEAKADMKKRGLRSPNRADALALTFAFPVKPKDFRLPQARGADINTYANNSFDPMKY